MPAAPPPPDGNPACRIDWAGLMEEFGRFQPDPGLAEHPAEAFAAALVRPVPSFAATMLAERVRRGASEGEAARDLYGFLLERRYRERLNLLFFAFDIFDGPDVLPEAVVAQTPLPHEDGEPGYRLRNRPGIDLGPGT